MEEKSSKSVIVAIIAVLVLIGGGIGIYTLTQDDETDTTTSEVTQNENPAPAEEEAAPSQNIVELAVATPQLSTLVAAVTQAGLVDTLTGEGPFTVLAPDDNAFAAALEALNLTAEELLAREDLGDILTYHVISGSVLSSALTNGQVVTTVQGGELTVDITEAGVFFVDANGGRAQVTTADVVASNGVVHIIDAVLLP
jgi:transforming growth factor-beta-induced protein